MAQQIDVKDLITHYDSLRTNVFGAYDKAIGLRIDLMGEIAREDLNALDEVIRLVNNAACTLRSMAF